ncbi:FAD:protein FMN transferase [Psychroserpens sp. SPM9]|uniref:FAD:protein FMN transferase n=1 Tax=Psychroserpens sp. SPM9 TaxID=2975598 RepID=UPI0021A8FA2C|nr:FAD:protein FMN transferase [Psychroserpens sp. SPM9]MDG5492838.1 FAD:protein FMN transferase [Psychroserpens sp. SPM9]
MKHLFVILLVFVFSSCSKGIENTKLSGPVFGTTYAVIYDAEIDYTQQIDSLFLAVNQALSTYLPDSDISKINRNEPVQIDHHFQTVLDASKHIYKETNGVFDPTIGIAVNAWDFGPKGRISELDSLKIDSVMQYVGMDKVNRVGQKVLKMQGAFLDFNAIAKGYGVDVIGEFLESKNVTNYLVEIGGEIRARGINIEKDNSWRVGLDEPRFDGEQSVYKAISLHDEAMATSGTYRKFKTDDKGNRYAHIIDAKTGYPSKTNILSVSVIAKDCMTADAYATAFQAMGIEKVTQFLKSHPELKVFMIFENNTQELETLNLNDFPE